MKAKLKAQYDYHILTDKDLHYSDGWPYWMRQRFLYNTLKYLSANCHLVRENGRYHLMIKGNVRNLKVGQVLTCSHKGHVLIVPLKKFESEFELIEGERDDIR